MLNIKEDYVGFETAKLLKEKGFNERCYSFYCWIFADDEGEEKRVELERWMEKSHNNSFIDEYFICSAPTLQMAMKWLRKKHKLYISINIEVGDIQMLPSYDFEETVLGYNFAIYNEETLIWLFKDKTPRSYEEACEAAIKYCLENLI